MLDAYSSSPGEGLYEFYNAGGSSVELASVEVAGGDVGIERDWQHDCGGGVVLEPDGDHCNVYVWGQNGVLRFITTEGKELFVRITPGILDGTEAPSDLPVMMLEPVSSLSSGYLTMRNLGERPARVLAVEITGGDLVWDDVDRDSCTGKVMEVGTTSCFLRVLGHAGTLRFFLDGEVPQDVAVDLDVLPTPSTPGSNIVKPVIATTTTNLGEGTTAQGHQWWWVTFVNDGERPAKVNKVMARRQLSVQQLNANGTPGLKDTCTGQTLGPQRTAGTNMVASCQVGLWGHEGEVDFTLDDSGTNSVAIDLDLLRGWLTQPEDITPPRFSDGAFRGKPYGTGPEVRLGGGYMQNSITVEDPLGIDRVELHMVRVDDGSMTDYLVPFDCTGNVIGDCNTVHTFCPQPSSTCTVPTIDYDCHVSWPPPRELPTNCKTKVRIDYSATTPTALWPHGTQPYNVPEGRYKMYWKAADGRGNWQRFDVTHPTVVFDYTPPLVALGGRLAASAFADQLAGGDLTISTDDRTSGVAWIKLFEYAGSSSNRLWEVPWARPNCTLAACDPHQYAVSYTLDPIAQGWQSGPHDLDVEAGDAAGNTSPPQPWRVNFWKTSWIHGGVDDRRITSTTEINAVRAALLHDGPGGTDGYNNPSSPVWNGLVPESTVWNGSAVVAGPPGDRAIIYPLSWRIGSLASNDHNINAPAEVAEARSVLGAGGYANAGALDGISPNDRPGIFATSWTYGNAGGAAHVVDTAGEIDAVQLALRNADDAGNSAAYDALWEGLSDADQERIQADDVASGDAIGIGDPLAEASQLLKKTYECVVSFRRRTYIDILETVGIDWGARLRCSSMVVLESAAYLEHLKEDGGWEVIQADRNPGFKAPTKNRFFGNVKGGLGYNHYVRVSAFMIVSGLTKNHKLKMYGIPGEYDPDPEHTNCHMVGTTHHSCHATSRPKILR